MAQAGNGLDSETKVIASPLSCGEGTATCVGRSPCGLPRGAGGSGPCTQCYPQSHRTLYHSPGELRLQSLAVIWTMWLTSHLCLLGQKMPSGTFSTLPYKSRAPRVGQLGFICQLCSASFVTLGEFLPLSVPVKWAMAVPLRLSESLKHPGHCLVPRTQQPSGCEERRTCFSFSTPKVLLKSQPALHTLHHIPSALRFSQKEQNQLFPSARVAATMHHTLGAQATGVCPLPGLRPEARGSGMCRAATSRGRSERLSWPLSSS